jgi:hypothetical protein
VPLDTDDDGVAAVGFGFEPIGEVRADG